jgi:hypothetical protein
MTTVADAVARVRAAKKPSRGVVDVIPVLNIRERF